MGRFLPLFLLLALVVVELDASRKGKKKPQVKPTPQPQKPQGPFSTNKILHLKLENDKVYLKQFFKVKFNFRSLLKLGHRLKKSVSHSTPTITTLT